MLLAVYLHEGKLRQICFLPSVEKALMFTKQIQKKGDQNA